nr:uncharacterized protein LOC125635199 [Caretta caretta]XP_048702534.1 uncharacterized protein LOC125635199 [Caretta caretta]XP_048702535.1 uncharacterized protein LOC125635199 [Caretta caretta]
MGGEVDRLPLLTATYMSAWSLLGSGPSDPQWEQEVMVNGETFLGWRDPGRERTVVRPWVVQPQMLRGCVSWVRVPGTKPLALPMAQIPVQTQEGWGRLVVGVLQDTSCETLLWGDCLFGTGSRPCSCNGQGFEFESREPVAGEGAHAGSDAVRKAGSSLPTPTGTARAALSTVGAETPAEWGETQAGQGRGSVGSGKVLGKESLDEPRQPCELMAVSSQQCGKARRVEDESPWTLPVTCVEKCDREGNVSVFARGIDLPMEVTTPVSKRLSVTSLVCWDKGRETPSCVSGKGESVSGSSLSVEQTEGAFQPVMVEGRAVVSEFVLDSAKAQEGNGPKFASARENGPVTRSHPVSVYVKSQRPDNSGACILPVASVLF